MATYNPYEPIWEGWRIPIEDDDTPWTLVIEPSAKAKALAELEELFASAPGAYPGTWVDPDEEP